MTIAKRNLLQQSLLYGIVFGCVGYTFVDVPQLRAQSPPTASAPLPSFEVASIKPARPGNDQPLIHVQYGRFRVTGATVIFLVQQAYGIKDFQVSGGPGWIKSEKYDINAKVEDSVVEEVEKLPRDQQWEQYELRVQSLLADRFKLQLRHETKDLPVYVLVIAKGGPKLQGAKPGDTYPNGIKDFEGHGHGRLIRLERIGGGQVKLTGQAIPINSIASGIPRSLVQWLTEGLGRPVLDQTGLKGDYDFTLEWMPDQSRAMFRGLQDGKLATDSQPLPESSGPSIFTAIQEQLGLKLESRKGPVEILGIDHVERPSEN